MNITSSDHTATFKIHNTTLRVLNGDTTSGITTDLGKRAYIGQNTINKITIVTIKVFLKELISKVYLILIPVI